MVKLMLFEVSNFEDFKILENYAGKKVILLLF